MDKKPEKKKRITSSKSVLNKDEHYFYKDGKQIGILKFIEEGNKIGIHFDWVDDEKGNGKSGKKS
jgi:hypothetical protein